MISNINTSKTVKIVILGEDCVGKSSICRSFFDIPFSQDILTTIGTEKFQYELVTKNDDKIKMYLWDTAGQERFRSMIFKSTRMCQGIILVFDFTSKYSFMNLDSWLEQIKDNYCPSTNIVLFGNKINIEKEKWEVTYEEAKNYAETRKLVYFETSAKTGQGIKEGISYLANEVYGRLESDKSSDGGVIKIGKNKPNEDTKKCIGKNRKSKNNEKKK